LSELIATLGLMEVLRDAETDPQLRGLFEQAYQRLLEIHHEDTRALIRESA
jgi:hypothetical protein